MHRFAPIVAMLFLLSPAWGSELGEPMDCQDWVVDLDVPGLAFESFLPYLERQHCDTQDPPDIRCIWPGGETHDAEGAIYFLKEELVDDIGVCNPLFRVYEIWRTLPDGNSQLVARLQERCGRHPADLHDRVWQVDFALDTIHGELAVRMGSACYSPGCDPTRQYLSGWRVCRLTGLPSLLDRLAWPPRGGSAGMPRAWR